MTEPCRTAANALCLVALLATSGCLMSLPWKESPAAGNDWKVDPRTLLARDGPIHPGVSRAAVRSALDVPPDYHGSNDHREEETYYFSNRAGAFFYLFPNPEGGLIGLNKRYIKYELTVKFDAHDVVQKATMKSYDVLDSHESAIGPYE